MPRTTLYTIHWIVIMLPHLYILLCAHIPYTSSALPRTYLLRSLERSVLKDTLVTLSIVARYIWLFR